MSPQTQKQGRRRTPGTGPKIVAMPPRPKPTDRITRTVEDGITLLTLSQGKLDRLISSRVAEVRANEVEPLRSKAALVDDLVAALAETTARIEQLESQLS
jgi:hypothetical protein